VILITKAGKKDPNPDIAKDEMFTKEKTMKKMITSLLMLSGMLLTLMVQPVYADQPNLLIMSEDADTDTVPRDSRVFRRVLTGIQNQMNELGFNVYDETLITLDGFAQGRTRRDRAEILDIARSIESRPIDVVVNFLIYAAVNDVGYTGKLRIRIEGEILGVKSGKYLGNFESISPRNWNIKPKCAQNRECVLEMVGDKARIIANDVGSVLAEKLEYMVTGGSGSVGDGPSQLETVYDLVFDGFTPSEVMDMEEYLVKFTGYESHRYTYNSNRRVEMMYEGTTSTSRMNRNLTRLMEELDLRAAIQFSSDNKVQIKKITVRDKKKKKDDDGW
jgi:hypothetical protein